MANAKQIAKMAKELGLVRGKGTHNGAAYWLRDGKIVTSLERKAPGFSPGM